MTSPCVGGLDLLADDHLDAVLLGLGPRLERARHLVVVGDRDRAQPLLARRGEQHLDRRRAVARVVGVHVQVDVDQLPRRRDRRRSAAGGAARRPRRRPPRSASATASQPTTGAAVREALPQPRVADQPHELCRERVDVAAARTAGRARRRAGSPRRRAAAPRPAPRPAPERAHEQPRRGRLPRRGGDEHVGRGEQLGLGVAPVVEHRHAVAQPRRPQRARPRPGGVKTVARQSRSRAAAAARAGTAAARAAPRGRRRRCAPGRRPRARASQLGARADHLVARRERSAPSARAWPRTTRSARRAARRSARRSAARPASRCTRSAGAWKVPTFSAREWRSASEAVLGANGSWTWTKSNGACASTASIVRATSSGGAGGMPRRAGASGSSSPTPSTPHAAVRREQLAGADQPRATRARARASATARAPPCGARGARARPRATRTKALTSCVSSQGWGVTCAMAKRFAHHRAG